MFKLKMTEYSEYPSIEPVSEGVKRPFWSVMIPSYNCDRYLERTLKSVLEQDPGSLEMQIEVVDDCSTKGDPQAVVTEIGKGRVSFFRQPRNIGATATFTTCVQRAQGHWVHILHGDDMVMPDFYQTYKRLICQYPDATLLFGPSIYIDEHDQQIGIDESMATQEGPVLDFACRQATRNWIKTPSVVIARKVYEKVGGFCELLCHAADWEMFFRAGLEGQAIATTTPYSCYRCHSGSDTSRLMLTGRNIEDTLTAIELCYNRLPQNLQHDLEPTKYLWIAIGAKYLSHELARKKYWKGSLVQATWAMRLNPNMEHLKLWIKATYKYIFFSQFTKLNPLMGR